MHKMLHDVEGNISSKRVMGSITVVVCLAAYILSGFGIEFSDVMFQHLVFGGFGLLASGVLEHMKRKK